LQGETEKGRDTDREKTKEIDKSKEIIMIYSNTKKYIRERETDINTKIYTKLDRMRERESVCV
jgi:hypothetical protein